MERSDLLDHLRRTHFESGDPRLALTNAERIARLLRMSEEVEGDLADLEALEEEFAGRPRTQTSHDLRARGSILHDFYNAIECIFLRIAPDLNGGVPNAERWEQQLLDDMRLDIPKVRPALIDEDLAKTLGEYLRFRHVFRNVYGSVLEAERLIPLEEKLPATLAAFRQQVQAFLAWLVEDDQASSDPVGRPLWSPSRVQDHSAA